MAFQNRPGQGALFKNRDHAKNPKSPNLKGDALLQLEDGSTVEIELAAWTKEGPTAGKWLSLSVKPKQIRQHFESGRDREEFDRRVQEIGTPLEGDLDAAFGAKDDEDIRFIVNFDVSPERRFRV
jgi:hypothetical protein